MKRPKIGTMRRYWALIVFAPGLWGFAALRGDVPLIVLLAAGPAVIAGLWIFLLGVEDDEAWEDRERYLDDLVSIERREDRSERP
jgi:fatty acid desaturase